MSKLYRGPSKDVFPTKLPFIWPSGFRGEDFLEINHLYKDDSFRPDPLSNLATTDNSCF
jgi:hypothetical protein